MRIKSCIEFNLFCCVCSQSVIIYVIGICCGCNVCVCLTLERRTEEWREGWGRKQQGGGGGMCISIIHFLHHCRFNTALNKMLHCTTLR